MAFLELSQLQVGIGSREILRDVSWRVERGRCLGILGESGSGKSMTACALMGLLPTEARIRSGSLRVDGQEWFGSSEKEWLNRRGSVLSIVFQEPSACLNPVMRVGTQIAESLIRHRGMGSDAAEAEAVRLLARVGIDRSELWARRFPHQMSGGMKQRVMIAIAVACGPKILIADEATSALDVMIQSQILELLRRLQRELDLGLILISHDLSVVASLADDVVVMKEGQVVESGATREILKTPRETYTHNLILDFLSNDGETA